MNIKGEGGTEVKQLIAVNVSMDFQASIPYENVCANNGGFFSVQFGTLFT